MMKRHSFTVVEFWERFERNPQAAIRWAERQEMKRIVAASLLPMTAFIVAVAALLNT